MPENIVSKNSPLLSFIVPYYNSGKTIDQTINSIRNQTYRKYEILIVDDGSTEIDSVKKLNAFKNSSDIQVIHQVNAGPSIARNKAIQLSRGEIIVPLDADDLIEPNAASEAIQLFNNSNGLGVVYGNLQFFHGENAVKIQQTFNIRKQILWNQIAVCAFIRKDIFTLTNGYDAFLSNLGLEDWEFWIRVYLTGWEFKKIESIQFKIRVHGNSRTYQQANKKLDEIKAYVYQKHALLIVKEFEKMFYDQKMIKETPDYKLGRFLLFPYRIIKKSLKK